MTTKNNLNNKHAIIIDKLHKEFLQATKKLNVLSNIDATFNQGSSYAITGVSGSGKSTLLHILGGLEKPTSGTVHFNDHNLYTLKQKTKERLLNQSIGFVFQFHYLIKELTVLENVMMKALIAGSSLLQAKEDARELLDHIGLTDKVNAYPTQLSGGEQQRVSIARALINKPAFLLADEPTGNLDADNAQRIVDLFRHFQEEYAMGLIICTHDQAVYTKMQTIMHLHEGVLK